jgi:hypothetical protein
MTADDHRRSGAPGQKTRENATAWAWLLFQALGIASRYVPADTPVWADVSGRLPRGGLLADRGPLAR